MQSKRIQILILFCVLTFLGLLGIQFYLIDSTYKLKEEEFKDMVNKKTYDAMNEIDIIDSLSQKFWSAKFKYLERYSIERDSLSKTLESQDGKILFSEKLLQFKENAINGFLIHDDSISNILNQRVNQILKREGIDYDIETAVVLTENIVSNERFTDTLLSEAPNQKNVLVGRQFDLKDALKVNNSTFKSSFSQDSETGQDTTSRNGAYIVKTNTYININNWRRIIFGQMFLILFLSALCFLAILSLFYFAVKALIQQEKTNQLKTDFINNVSHELKTPLTTSKLAIKSLQKNIEKGKDLSEDLQVIERQQNRLNQLVNQVLHTRVEQEGIQLNTSVINSQTFLDQLLGDFEIFSQNHAVDIIAKNEAQLPIEIDTFQMTTALNNILENAIKYNPQGVQILVDSSQHQANWQLTIKDNGIGLGLKNRDKHQVFEKFYRVPKGDIHNVKGLGLGLFLSRQIIQAHGGNIRVESSKGEGCNFIISLPINQ